MITLLGPNLLQYQEKLSTQRDLTQKMSQIMDLLEEDVKQSHKETQKLMAEKEAAEKAEADTKGAEENLQKMMEWPCMLISSSVAYARSALIAHSSTEIIVNVHQLDHLWSFILLWLPLRVVPQQSAEAVKVKPVMAVNLKELFENKHIYMVHYNCPITSCLIDMESKPIKNSLAGRMINAVNDILGHPAKQVDLNPHLNEGDIWADIFYEA
ncbi:hypothetical protein EDD17DRAFT_1517271 [Pisolithus thermaeus]|nr:hypothetical protein EDD17DRAFT_1517271 [Pisolithus thermaeus]